MPEPLTVMHLRASNFVGGPEKQILEHFRRLDARRFIPVLATFVEDGKNDPLGDAALSSGFRCVQMNTVSPLNPRSVLQLSHVLKQEKVSILCTHGYKPNILGLFASSLARIPNIAISRGWTWESPKIRLYEQIDRLFLHWCDHVVAVSGGQRDKILSCGVRGEKVSVIHNAINLDGIICKDDKLLRRELGLPADALIVASAGRLSPEKNYLRMIDAAAEVAANDERVFFIIFGEGFQRQELERKIMENGLAGRFILPGFRSDLQAILHEIDIFMLPSLTEGLPNVVLEAFAVRKPVVVTAVGGTPEVVQDGISGFLTTPEDVSGMAENLQTLISNQSLRLQMGLAGYEYVKSNFGFDAQTVKYERLYADVCRVLGRGC